MQVQAARIATIWKGLPLRARVALSLVAIGVLAAMIVLIQTSTSREWVAVGGTLKPEQVGEAQTLLEEQGFETRLSSTGGIEVPAESEPKVTAALMGAGIAAKGTHADCEDAFGEKSMGSLSPTSKEMDEKIRACRANELSNMIETIPMVQSAQVNLTMPEEALFASEEQEPTAAVAVVTDGERLPGKTVSGIQKTVAATVAGLRADNVVVTDDSGRTLSDESGGGGISENELKLRAEQNFNAMFENKYRQYYEKIVGGGNVQVLSNAELDMDEIRREVKDVGGEDNEQGPRASEVTNNEVLKGQSSGLGVQGPAGTPSDIGVDPEDNRAVAEDQIDAGDAGDGGYAGTKDAVTYSNDEVAEAIRVAPGKVTRNRVSLLVSADVPAETATSIENSMRAVMGGNPADSFSMEQVAFAPTEKAPATGPTRAQTIASYMKWIVLGLGLVAIAFVVRRSLTQRTAELLNPLDDMILLEGRPGFDPIPLAELEAALANAMPVEQSERIELQKKVEQIAETKPHDVANELRRWMQHDEAQAFPAGARTGRR